MSAVLRSSVCQVIALFVMGVVGIAYAAPSAIAGEHTLIGVKKLVVEAPPTCTAADRLTVYVYVEARNAWNVDVTLYEDDLIRDDKIETKTITRSASEGKGDWEGSVEFTFNPKKFEKGKTLEFYAKAVGAKSNKVKVSCR